VFRLLEDAPMSNVIHIDRARQHGLPTLTGTVRRSGSPIRRDFIFGRTLTSATCVDCHNYISVGEYCTRFSDGTTQCEHCGMLPDI
jgi:hypothetical protein